MLGAFAKNVAEAPKELSCPTWSADITPIDRPSDGAGPDELLRSFPGSVKVGVSGIGGVAFTPGAHKAMAVMEGVVCIMDGQIDNLSAQRREYGLPPNCSQESLLIHAFITLRDRGPIPPDRVVRDLAGHFAFVLFDTKNRIVFAARDRHGGSGGISLMWGTSRDGSTVFSDNAEFLRSACGKSFAPFPSGCYFSTNMGIKSYEFPSAKLKAMPRVDSKGHVTAAIFGVDTKKDLEFSSNMRRVGSEANWAQTI